MGMWKAALPSTFVPLSGTMQPHNRWRLMATILTPRQPTPPARELSPIPPHDPLPLMERERLLERLSTAKAYVEKGNLQIAAQKCVIIDLKAADRSTAKAENLLWWFELDQESNLAAVERILDALDNSTLVREAAQF